MQKYTNTGSVPWYPRESRSPCKNALNDSTIASSISWWQGWYLFHCISPMSLQDGKNLYRQTTVGYWFCMFVTNSFSRRTVLQINLYQGIEEIICAAANTDGGTCLLPMAHFLQNNWPTSFYQIVSGFWLQRIFWSQFSVPRHKWKNVS